MRHTGFEPVIGPSPRVLILGTFPGLASRDGQQYYAHPRNAFWPIMTGLLGDDFVHVDYEARKELLRRHHIALWDIVQSCETDGSADTEIKNPRLIDLPGLLQAHPTICLVCFNGGNAAKFAKRLGKLTVDAAVLPSTSPANARHSPAQKLDKWREILQSVLKTV